MNEVKTGETDLITLEPIRTAGPAALDTHGEPGLKKVTLREIKIAWHAPNHESITIRSDDLLPPSSKSALPAPIPEGGQVAAVALDFFLDDDTHPHRVDLRPPSTIQLQFDSDADRIHAWINKTPLHIALKALTIIVLALASAIAPALDDDDGDEDDIDSDRTAFAT